MRSTTFAALAVVLAATLALAGCSAGHNDVVEGSSLAVASSQPFYSYNAATAYGNEPANNDIVTATNSSFNYYDNTPKLQKDESFGSYEKLSDDPLIVKYTIADGVTWSDGTAVDAADLLLNWAALSRSLDTPDVDASEFTDPETGELTGQVPKGTVYFDSGANPSTGLGLVSAVPHVSDDHQSITLTYSKPFVDWELVFRSAGLPAHVIAAHALGLKDPQKAKDAVISAIQKNDRKALAALSAFWNTGFTVTSLPKDRSLLVGNGPYSITGLVADQSVTLTANTRYVGSHRPRVQKITVRLITDPLAAVQALHVGEVQVIAPQATVEAAKALDSSDATVLTGSESTYEHLDLQFGNSKNAVFDNPLIRQAFLKVVPRQQILDTVIAPLHRDATLRNSQVFLPGTPGYGDSAAGNGSAAYASVDVDGARALLAQAGVTNPQVCILFAPTNPRRASEFQLIQQSAALAGFSITDCSSADWRGLLGTPGAYDAALFGWEANNLGVTTGAASTFATGAIDNRNFYSNAEVDRLTAQLGSEFDRRRQIAIQKKIDALVWGDFYGVTLFQYPSITGFDHTKIRNVKPSPLAPTLFWNVWQWEPVSSG